MNSLDPRVSRMKLGDQPKDASVKAKEYWQTYEVFHQTKAGGKRTHVGSVHASKPDVALLFAKEQFARRGNCYNLWVVRTIDVYGADLEQIQGGTTSTDTLKNYTAFLQKKSGTHHQMVGPISAPNEQLALLEAKAQYTEKGGHNLWVIEDSLIYAMQEEDADIFATNSEKEYREATLYRVREKIEAFKQKNS